MANIEIQYKVTSAEQPNTEIVKMIKAVERGFTVIKTT
jgi:hypothetical protein